MNKIPKVSVILTSYNHEKFIRMAIDSVLSQTFSDFELIIVDDCSTDHSWEIITSYNDPRIRTFHAPKNQRTATVYEGIRMATGKYLAIHHSDDYWNPQKLEKQVRWLENHSDDIAVFTHVQTVNEKNTPRDSSLMECFNQKNRSSAQWLRFFFDNGNCLCHPSVMMRTSYAKSLYTNYGLTAINDFRNWVMTCIKYHIHIIEEKLCYFRIRDKLRNDSAPTSGQIAKHNIELPFILECYEQINNIDFFLEIFPEAKKYINNGEINLEYAFALLCLQTKLPPYEYYGLAKLIRLLKNEHSRLQLEKLYNFSTKDMADLGRRYDPFFINGRKIYDEHTEILNIVKNLPYWKKILYSIAIHGIKFTLKNITTLR